MATTHITHDGSITVVKVVLEEGEAWHGAYVHVSVRKPTHTEPDHLAQVHMFAEEYDDAGKDGTLYISSWECSNDDSWENHYPEYFSNEMVEANA